MKIKPQQIGGRLESIKCGVKHLSNPYASKDLANEQINELIEQIKKLMVPDEIEIETSEEA